MTSAVKPELKPIRARLKKITPGPWCWEPVGEKSNGYVVGIGVDRDGTQFLGRLPDDEWVEDSVLEDSIDSGVERKKAIGENEGAVVNYADADFIAHAPTDIALLIAEVARLHKLLKAAGGLK